MSLNDTLMQDMKTAMKAKDKEAIPFPGNTLIHN